MIENNYQTFCAPLRGIMIPVLVTKAGLVCCTLHDNERDALFTTTGDGSFCPATCASCKPNLPAVSLSKVNKEV